MPKSKKVYDRKRLKKAGIKITDDLPFSLYYIPANAEFTTESNRNGLCIMLTSYYFIHVKNIHEEGKFKYAIIICDITKYW